MGETKDKVAIWKAAQEEQLDETSPELLDVESAALRFDRRTYYEDMFQKYLTFPKKGYVLEIGSGVSGPIYFVLEAGMTKIAIDPYLGVLKVRSKHVEMIRSVGEYLPLRTGAIDVIFLHNALDHAFSPRSVMEESRRVSKGDVFILARIFDRFVLMFLGKLLSRFDHGHPNHLTADGVLHIVSNCALQPKLVETYWGDHSKVPLLRLLRLGRIRRALSVLIQKRIVIVASPANRCEHNSAQ